MKQSLIQPYIEYGNANGISITSCLSEANYDGQKEVVQYLRECGHERGISMRAPVDYLTGERISTAGNVFYSDEFYSWNDTLAYYVEKYNLKLPDEFIKYVVKKLQN